MGIKQKDTWLGNRLEAMSQDEILEIFKEITQFKRTGLLEGRRLRRLEAEFSENVSHTPGGECMRLVEEEVLFEMARRFYNEKAPVTMPASSYEDTVRAKIAAYISDPETRVSTYHNNEIGEWLYSVVVENSGEFWLDSFPTLEEAEEYIRKNNLKKVE